LRITLDDVKPAVLRRVEVRFDIRLDRLHLTIQAAMGWTNSHLYEIRAGGVGWSTPYPEVDGDGGDFLDACKARLGDILADTSAKTLQSLSPLPFPPPASARLRASSTRYGGEGREGERSTRSSSSASPIPSRACAIRA